MLKRHCRLLLIRVAIAGVCGSATMSFAGTNSGTYDYSHRMRNCDLTVKLAGQVASGKEVEIKLIRNHFGFGGSIRRWAFDTLKAGVDGVTQNYGETFLKYFDYATPENEMKWAYIQGDSVKNDPNWSKADFIVTFCQNNDIKIRGHNLFWNEKKDWIPKWTWGLNSTSMKTAMRERITDAMTRYNGKLAQWDIVNEIIHGANNGSAPSKTMLDSMTGDPNVFAWILDEARKIDTTAQFVINDYNMLSGGQSQIYIDKCKPLATKFDIIGDEAHLGTGVLTKAGFDTKINALSTGINNKKVWLTELDWQGDISKSAAQMELVMRSSFANINVEGVVVWVWCKRKMWGEMTSYFVDSLLQETATGKKWRDVREEWKTKVTKAPDASGKLNFNGYQGKYTVSFKEGSDIYIDTFYLEPGTGAKTVEVNLEKYAPPVRVEAPVSMAHGGSRVVSVNGRPVLLTAAPSGGQLYLSTYSVSGRLLSKIPFSVRGAAGAFVNVPAGCHVFRISTADRVFYAGIGLQLRR